MAHFLQRRPLEEARAMLLEGVVPVDAEEVGVDDALGRVAASDVEAVHPSPHYRASAMDGLAVLASETSSASPDAPLLLRAVDAGEDAPGPRCAPVDTGSLLPDWADAVVRIEDAAAVEGGFRIRAAVATGRDVRRAGEDIDAGTLVVAAGQRLGPADLGALLATGTTRIVVRRRPSVALLATGTEVVDPGAGAGPGQVIESNSRVLAAMVLEWGGTPHRLGIVADDEAALRAAIADAAARFDVVCVIAGSSAGRKDFTIATLAALGEVFVHGVDIAPGRPVALARLGDGSASGRGMRPAIAVPGYPVSAIVACETLLRPLLAALQGTPEPLAPRVLARLARKLPSRLGVEEFRRVALALGRGGELVVAPLPSGAGSIRTVTGAHGWLRIPSTVEGLDAGAGVEVELRVAMQDVDAALVLGGSPSHAARTLERRLRGVSPRARLAFLGLSDGDALRAVDRGEAHAALLDVVPGTPSPGLRVDPTESDTGVVFAVTREDRDDVRARLFPRRSH